MNRKLLATCVSGVLLAAAPLGFAGFTVTASFPVTSGGFDRYDIVAVNTGGDTGVQLKGLEYFYQGAAVAFQVDDTSDPAGGDPDGIPDTVNLLSQSRTRIRVSTTGANNVFVGVSPSNEFAQPNPYAGGVTAFQGVVANTGTTNASGAGFQIARFFLPTGSLGGVFSGNIGGDIGSKVPFSVRVGPYCHRCSPINPVIVNNASTTVTFGQVVTNGAPFSVVITATDADVGDVLALSVGALPAGISNVTVSPATSSSPANFTITGLVDYSLNGTTVIVPISVTATSGSATGSFMIVVVPEPNALGLLLLGAARRRR